MPRSLDADAVDVVREVIDMHEEQLEQMRSGDGFLGALDDLVAVSATDGAHTSEGSEDASSAGDAWPESEAHESTHALSPRTDPFDLGNEMVRRGISSPSFSPPQVAGAILHELTMDREIEGRQAAQHLWLTKRIVPILAIDRGLAPEANGVRPMQDNPDLGYLLARANATGFFGARISAEIGRASVGGIHQVVDQQFEVAARILDTGLTPVLAPVITSDCPDRAEAEGLLLEALLAGLDDLAPGHQVIVALTLPSVSDFYRGVAVHPGVLRIAGLCDERSLSQAADALSENRGMIACFSSTLAEGLAADQYDDDFNDTLARNVQAIHAASVT